MFKSMMLSTILLLAMLSPAWSASNPHALDENLDNAVNFKEIVDKIPPAKTGVAFSIVEGNLNFLTEFEIARWKGLSFNLGYAGAQENSGHKAIASLEYDLINAQKLGIDTPILKYIDLSLGIWGGAGRWDNPLDFKGSETDWGVSATAVKFRFW